MWPPAGHSVNDDVRASPWPPIDVAGCVATRAAAHRDFNSVDMPALNAIPASMAACRCLEAWRSRHDVRGLPQG